MTNIFSFFNLTLMTAFIPVGALILALVFTRTTCVQTVVDKIFLRLTPVFGPTSTLSFVLKNIYIQCSSFVHTCAKFGNPVAILAYLTDLLWILLGCPYCLTFWLTFIFTQNLVSAILAGIFAHVINSLFPKVS